MHSIKKRVPVLTLGELSVYFAPLREKILNIIGRCDLNLYISFCWIGYEPICTCSLKSIRVSGNLQDFMMYTNSLVKPQKIPPKCILCLCVCVVKRFEYTVSGLVGSIFTRYPFPQSKQFRGSLVSDNNYSPYLV